MPLLSITAKVRGGLGIITQCNKQIQETRYTTALMLALEFLCRRSLCGDKLIGRGGNKTQSYLCSALYIKFRKYLLSMSKKWGSRTRWRHGGVLKYWWSHIKIQSSSPAISFMDFFPDLTSPPHHKSTSSILPVARVCFCIFCTPLPPLLVLLCYIVYECVHLYFNYFCKVAKTLSILSDSE